jgi:hypothetical protein
MLDAVCTATTAPMNSTNKLTIPTDCKPILSISFTINLGYIRHFSGLLNTCDIKLAYLPTLRNIGMLQK